MRRIVDKILDGLKMRLQEQKIDMEVTESAYDHLMESGYDPRFGAREMERAVDRLLIQPLGKALLNGRFVEGATVRVLKRDGELALEDAGRTRPLA